MATLVTPPTLPLILATFAPSVTATRLRANPPPNAADTVPVFYDPWLRTYYTPSSRRK